MNRKLFTSALACLAIGLQQLTATAVSQEAEGQLTMREVDIRAFINDVARLTGKTIIVDPRVQGKVTLSARDNLGPKELFAVFSNVIRAHGYTVVPAGDNEYRITPVEEAAQDAPLVQNYGHAGQMATTVIRLEHADAAEAAKLVRPILHSRGKVSAAPGGRVLVVTDFPENLRKARSVVQAMDLQETEMQTIRLHNLTAIDAENALRELQGPNPPVAVVGVPANNSLILKGRSTDISRIRSLLQALDRSGPAERGSTSVVQLRHASGEELVKILSTLLEGHIREGQPRPSVAHEAGSNAIIINATPEIQKAMEEVVRQLDVRRPQVLVEAIIVEVSDTVARDLGVQFALADPNGNNVPLISSNFNRAGPNILALTGALAGDQLGLSQASRDLLENAAVASLLGLQGGTLGISTRGSDGVFSAILNAVETDEDSNVLSTPFVTTLDNVPATFLVGQEIPITTGETLAGVANVNPFRTFERMEVGIKLNVLPQISDGDVIRLSIAQEVSSIAGPVSITASDFVTNKRQIETTVLAEDGQVIVLGGLIKDDEVINLQKIPLLGDLPVMGNLFRSEGKSRVRRNLMVFLRPSIIRNAEDAAPLTASRMDYIRAEDIGQSGRETSKLDTILGDR